MNELATQKIHEENMSKVKTKQNALEAIATRLQISPSKLQSTLLNTVFKKASQDEFAALLIVANTYGLNPLTKEIYAFPAKGGGIVPLISIDGWIRIMNEHPQFDGYEHNDILQDGEFIAVETVIYRKDRSRAIKVTEYLDECIRSTEPWKQMPRRMLRHKSLIQCARIAFGYSGFASDSDDYAVIHGGDLEPMKQASVSVPKDRDLKKLEAEQEGADVETGEIVEQEPERGPSQAEQDAIDQELDAKSDAELNGDTVEEPEEEAISASQAKFNELAALLQSAKSLKDVKAADDEYVKHMAGMDDAHVSILDREMREHRNKFAS